MGQSTNPHPYERTLSPDRAKIKTPRMPPPVKTLPLTNGEAQKSGLIKQVLSHKLFLDWSIDKSAVRLEQLLGEGQFGIVYRGTYCDKEAKKQQVAIKVCRAEKEAQDISVINKHLLDEACKL